MTTNKVAVAEKIVNSYSVKGVENYNNLSRLSSQHSVLHQACVELIDEINEVVTDSLQRMQKNPTKLLLQPAAIGCSATFKR